MTHTDDPGGEFELADGTPARLAVKCRRCEGWVHSPASVRNRIGPVCARHERADARRAAEPGLFDLPAAAAAEH